MNTWTFTGNLGRDAEQKFLPNGTALLSFSVAVKSGYGDKAKTTWVNCGLFGKRAEGALAQYLIKGAQVCINGEAYLDEWEKDGVQQKMLKVNVNELDLIGGKPDNAQGGQQSPQQGGYHQPQQQRPAPQQQGYGNQPQKPQQQPVNTGQGLPPGDDWQDDIPF